MLSCLRGWRNFTLFIGLLSWGQDGSVVLLAERSVVRTRPLPLDFPCLALGNLAVFQPSCNLRVAWQLGTERVLQLNHATVLSSSTTSSSSSSSSKAAEQSFALLHFTLISTTLASIGFLRHPFFILFFQNKMAAEQPNISVEYQSFAIDEDDDDSIAADEDAADEEEINSLVKVSLSDTIGIMLSFHVAMFLCPVCRECPY
ncbi:hypothetical protein CSKR_107177 [Clonorchis sinensis]|uniref:Uncharacterized protein n=1 Tax=Clonorchis sinensis TaxID=79923 RepID=A0A419QD83_CLOSI|nr:hypothetical protein CSKR_107177 [Clonorchis sinensis]